MLVVQTVQRVRVQPPGKILTETYLVCLTESTTAESLKDFSNVLSFQMLASAKVVSRFLKSFILLFLNENIILRENFINIPIEFKPLSRGD